METRNILQPHFGWFDRAQHVFDGGDNVLSKHIRYPDSHPDVMRACRTAAQARPHGVFHIQSSGVAVSATRQAQAQRGVEALADDEMALHARSGFQPDSAKPGAAEHNGMSRLRRFSRAAEGLAWSIRRASHGYWWRPSSLKSREYAALHAMASAHNKLRVARIKEEADFATERAAEFSPAFAAAKRKRLESEQRTDFARRRYEAACSRFASELGMKGPVDGEVNKAIRNKLCQAVGESSLTRGFDPRPRWEARQALAAFIHHRFVSPPPAEVVVLDVGTVLSKEAANGRTETWKVIGKDAKRYTLEITGDDGTIRHSRVAIGDMRLVRENRQRQSAVPAEAKPGGSDLASRGHADSVLPEARASKPQAPVAAANSSTSVQREPAVDESRAMSEEELLALSPESLAGLTELSVQIRTAEGAKRLSQLAQLEALRLTCLPEAHDEASRALSSLRNLRELTLFTDASHPFELERLPPQLIRLSLRSVTPKSGGLSGLPSGLRELHIDALMHPVNLSELKGLDELALLSIYSVARPPSLAGIHTLGSVKELRLAGFRLDDKTADELRNGAVQTVDVSSCTMRDDITFMRLAAVQSVRTIRYDPKTVSAGCIEELQRELPSLTLIPVR